MATTMTWTTTIGGGVAPSPRARRDRRFKNCLMAYTAITITARSHPTQASSKNLFEISIKR